MGNKSFFFQLFHSKSWNFCKKNRGKLMMYMFLLMFLIEGYRLYRYYNRLEFIRKTEYNGDIFEQYQDWSKSTGYYVNVYRRCDEKNYYVIKKNGEIYFKYRHNYPFAERSYQDFFFFKIEQDSLVLVQKGSDYYGVVYLKLPLHKDRITKKDVRIIAIYPGILKDGREIEPGDTTHYLLDDYKKVPKEVINYDHVISDY